MRKKLSGILSVLLVVLFSLSIVACSSFNQSQQSNQTGTNGESGQTGGPDDSGEPEEPDPPVVTPVGEGFVRSSYETLSGVDPDYEIGVTAAVLLSCANLSEYVVVYDQTEEEITLHSRNDGGTYYLSPKGGFEAGFTYSVQLLSTAVKFVDTRFADKDSMSFTVKRPQVMNVVEKKEIKVIEDFPVMTYQPDCILTANVSENYGIQVNDVVKIPVLFYGFKVQRCFVALSIEENEGSIFIELREATIEEIYDEIDISTSRPISAENVYVRYRNEPPQTNIPEDAMQIILQEDRDIIEEVENSDFVKNSVQRLSARKSGDAKIKTEFSIKDVSINDIAYVQINCKTVFTLPLVSKDKGVPVDFNVTFDVTFTIGVPNAVINPFNKAFGFTVHTITETKVTITFTAKKDIGDIGNLDKIISDNGGLDEFNKFVKNLNGLSSNLLKPEQKDLQAKLFQSYVPVGGGILGIVVELRIAIKIEVKAEAKLEIVNKTSREFGIRKEKGLRFFNNVLEETNYTNASLEGNIEIKAGPVIGLYISASGIVNAGIEFGAGAYAKAAGVFSVQFRPAMQTSTAFAGYVELGLYKEFNVIAQVDLGIWKGTLKVYELEDDDSKTPLLLWGRTKMVTLQPKTNSVTLNNEDSVKIPDIDVIVKDLLTHEKTVATVKGTDFNKKFEIEDPSSNVAIDDKGQVVLKAGHEEEFVDEIKVKLKNYEEYFGEPPALYPFYVGINPEKYLVTSFTVTKQPVRIDKLALRYEQVLEDSEYSQVSGVDAEYSSRNTEDFQIGRLVL